MGGCAASAGWLSPVLGTSLVRHSGQRPGKAGALRCHRIWLSLQAAPAELKLAQAWQVCILTWTCTAAVHPWQPGQSLVYSSVKSAHAYRSEIWSTHFTQENLRVRSQANRHLKGLIVTSLCGQWQLLQGSRESLWFISSAFYIPPHLSHWEYSLF